MTGGLPRVGRQGGIFINYRRDDDPSFAGRLHDRLSATFGPDRIFIDVDSIAFGEDFVDKLNRSLAECMVLLAIIGPRWLSVTNNDGRPRLKSPRDYVRMEIEQALSDPEIRVIPILVDKVAMPAAGQLPRSLAPLAKRQACRVSHERFSPDIRTLIDDIGNALESATHAVPTESQIERLENSQSGSRSPNAAKVRIFVRKGEGKEEIYRARINVAANLSEIKADVLRALDLPGTADDYFIMREPGAAGHTAISLTYRR